jgi:tetratricopeptide (TPR) repeat protein
MSPEETIKRAEDTLAGGDFWGAERVLATRWADTADAPPAVLHLLGAIRLRQRDFPQSEQFYRRAIKASPLEPRHHAALGELLFTARHYGPAADAFGHALRLDSKLGGIWFAYGRACFRAKRYAEAEKAARTAIAQSPSSQFLDMLSAALREQGKGKEALEAAEQALQVEPGDPAVRHTRAAALTSVGRDAEALTEFDAVAQRGIETPSTGFFRAKALVNLGRRGEALEVVESGLQRWPRDERLQAAASELRKRG